MYLKRLRELREDHDKYQKEIAEILNISQQYYSEYEKGKRPIPVDYIIKLAKFYHVSADYILELTDNPKPFWRNKLFNH